MFFFFCAVPVSGDVIIVVCHLRVFYKRCFSWKGCRAARRTQPGDCMPIAWEVVGCVSSSGRARDIRHQGDGSPVGDVVECVRRRAGTGKARGQTRTDSWGQERDAEVARQATVRTTSYARWDSQGADGDTGIVAWSGVGYWSMQASRVAYCARRLYSSRSVYVAYVNLFLTLQCTKLPKW